MQECVSFLLPHGHVVCQLGGSACDNLGLFLDHSIQLFHPFLVKFGLTYPSISSRDKITDRSSVSTLFGIS
ncbi:hypothetical protein PFISCL1PPCAC_27103, partial [Pristionchus fissidentatus]